MTSLMKKITGVVAAAAMALSATAATAAEIPMTAAAPASIANAQSMPAGFQLSQAPQAEKIVVAGRRGAGIALGAAALIGGAILLNERARARDYDRGYGRSYGVRGSRYNQCNRWEYRCHELGVRRACRNLRNNCY